MRAFSWCGNITRTAVLTFPWLRQYIQTRFESASSVDFMPKGQYQDKLGVCSNVLQTPQRRIVSPKVSARGLEDFERVTAYTEGKKKFGLRSDNKVSAKA